MKREDIIRKIEGLLAVSKGEANEAESQTALLLARKLMAKHDIDFNDVEREGYKEGDGIVSYKVNEPKIIKWYESQLMSIIADNFKVKWYTQRVGGNKSELRFYGYEQDCDFAREVFFMALDAMLFHVKEYLELYYITDGRYIQKTAKHTNEIKDSYMNGFLTGLQEAFKSQNKEIEEEYGLIIVTPALVEEHYEVAMRGAKSARSNRKRTVNSDAYFEGLNDGRSTDTRNKARLEGGE